jgi:fructose-specific phosphotransferase system component IIB
LEKCQNILLPIPCPSNQKILAPGASQNVAKTKIHRVGALGLTNRYRPEMIFIAHLYFASAAYSIWEANRILDSSNLQGISYRLKKKQISFCPSLAHPMEKIAPGASQNGAKTEFHRLGALGQKNRYRPEEIIIAHLYFPSAAYSIGEPIES